MTLSGELLSKIQAAKDEVIAAGIYLGRRQYHVALSGMSAHGVSDDLLICARHGPDKEALKAEDLVVCELSGRKVDGATAAGRLADRSSGKPPLVLHGAE